MKEVDLVKTDSEARIRTGGLTASARMGRFFGRYGFPMVFPALFVKFDERLSFLIGRWKFRVLAWMWGVRYGTCGMFSGPTIVRNLRKGGIVLGDDVIFISRRIQSMIGCTHPTILDTRCGGKIIIGNHSGFSSVSISSRALIRIGSHVTCGANARIYDHDFHSLEHFYRWTPEDFAHVRSSPIEIGDDVFIGANSIILKGTKVGARSIIAAGSVVFGLDIPPDSMVKGNPAAIVGGRKNAAG